MNHEIIEEKWVVEENSTVSTIEVVLRDLPPATKMEEVLVKQEWVELCEQRRLLIKQRYQLQFKKTMRLKMEVRKLRKQVHQM